MANNEYFCPKCSGEKLNAQVTAWAKFSEATGLTIIDESVVMADADNTQMECTACGPVGIRRDFHQPPIDKSDVCKALRHMIRCDDLAMSVYEQRVVRNALRLLEGR